MFLLVFSTGSANTRGGHSWRGLCCTGWALVPTEEACLPPKSTLWHTIPCNRHWDQFHFHLQATQQINYSLLDAAFQTLFSFWLHLTNRYTCWKPSFAGPPWLELFSLGLQSSPTIPALRTQKDHSHIYSPNLTINRLFFANKVIAK